MKRHRGYFEKIVFWKKVPYNFYLITATSEGSISMAHDEEMHILEMDQGDGWTRVRRIVGECEEGFVPTSYIDCNYFNT